LTNRIRIIFLFAKSVSRNVDGRNKDTWSDQLCSISSGQHFSSAWRKQTVLCKHGPGWLLKL